VQKGGIDESFHELRRDGQHKLMGGKGELTGNVRAARREGVFASHCILKWIGSTGAPTKKKSMILSAPYLY